jgi:hypothetical protein
MTHDFESFSDEDDEWLSELETRAIDLENELFDWREYRAREQANSRSREQAETVYRRAAMPGPDRAAFHQGGADAVPQPREGPAPAVHSAVQSAARTANRPRPAEPEPEVRPAEPEPEMRPYSADERTRALIDQGRPSVKRSRMSRGRVITIATAAGIALVTVLVMAFFRKGPSWPDSVTTVKAEIATACQNPNVASEPAQANFACDKATNQILWIFALMTSNDNPNYDDAKSGRLGLEPITPTQGGEVAWSLNLHHPYNPQNAIDSLTVAARAVNNIIGGATLTNAKGAPAVQPGLESNPANCARYTGSSAVISRAGFPDVCAQPVTTVAGQAALVADAYREWVVGATIATANNVAVLFENANKPGNAQVQAILQTLPGAQ